MLEGCRPMEGSSSTYSTPVVRLRTARASCIRCRSPVERVDGGPVQASDIPAPAPSAAGPPSGRTRRCSPPWGASPPAGMPGTPSTQRVSSARVMRQASSREMPRSLGARACLGQAGAAAVGADVLLQELLHPLHALLVLHLGQGVFHRVDGVVIGEVQLCRA